MSDARPNDGAPLVGIVVAAYNAERFVARTLQSITEQTLERWCCVVVDDGSTDSTRAIADDFAARDTRFTAWTQPNGGPARARNHGFGLLPPDVRYVTFMDADDVWMPDALGSLVEATERSPGSVGAHALGMYIDEAGEPAQPGAFEAYGRHRLHCGRGWPRRLAVTEPTTFESITVSSTVFPPGLLLARRSVYEQVGLFDPSLQPAEDWDMAIRITRQGPLAFVDRPLIQYRRHPTSASMTDKMRSANALVGWRTFHSRENSAEQQKAVVRIWRATQVRDVWTRLRSLPALLRGRQIRAAARAAAGIPLVIGRWLRGRPSLRLGDRLHQLASSDVRSHASN